MAGEEDQGPDWKPAAPGELPQLIVESATGCALVAPDVTGRVTYWNIGAET